MNGSKRWLFGLTFLLITMFSFSAVHAQEEHANETNSGAYLIYFHLAQIVMAIVVARVVFLVIDATGLWNIYVYILAAMAFFVISAIVGYQPHVTNLAEEDAELYALALNSVALLLMSISFYKWKKMLG